MGSRDLTKNSEALDVIAVTIAASPVNIRCGATGTSDSTGAVTFTSKPCVSCLVQIFSGSAIYMAFGKAATAAATSWKLSTTPISVPVTDLTKLNFIGGAGNEVVQIMWRG